MLAFFLKPRIFAPVQTGPGVHLASSTMGTGSVLGVKRLGVALTTHFYLASRLKKRVDVYFYSPSVSSWQVIG